MRGGCGRSGIFCTGAGTVARLIHKKRGIAVVGRRLREGRVLASAEQSGLQLLVPREPHQIHRRCVLAAKGMDAATRPLSYLQLKPIQGPAFEGWYCRCVVWLNLSSWSIRKGKPLGPTVVPRPLVCGGKNRAATLDITTSAVNPWRSGTLMRIAYPGILELCQPIGKKIGVAASTLKSYAVCVYFHT